MLSEIEGIGQLMVISIMEFFSDKKEKKKPLLSQLLGLEDLEPLFVENL